LTTKSIKRFGQRTECTDS